MNTPLALGREDVGFLPSPLGLFVVTKRLVNRGTADKPVWEREFCPIEPDETVLRTLLTGKTRKEGGLVWRVPKA